MDRPVSSSPAAASAHGSERTIRAPSAVGRLPWRAIAAAATFLTIACAAPSPAGAETDPSSTDAAVELAERHAPIVWIRQQEGPCDTDGEQFEPTAADIVLDNPEVLLRQVGNEDPVVMRGPTAADIFDLREGWFLDFPGDALDPGCLFETDFRRFAAGRSSVVYAHVATQADRPGFLALQYWFFWYHNPAKNDHEGDWEFVQLLFDVDTAAEALRTEPIAVGYAQHVGGERASWGDDKFEKAGVRPVVYPAVGSHASYFGQALYLGRSGSEGFGCDNTDGPSRRLDPEVVVLPSEVTDPDDPLAWLSFQGRWGQRERGFFNGPTGPFEKARWTEPVSWHESLRESSVVIPGADQADGVAATFCVAVETGSTLLVRTLRNPATALLALVLLGGAATAVALSTSWARVDPRPIRRRRAVGEILRSAGQVVRERPAAMAAIGLISIPISLLTSMVQWAALSVPLVDNLVELVGSRSALSFVIVVSVGSVGNVVTYVVISAAVATTMDSDARPGADHVALVRSQLGALAGATARAVGVVVALLVSVVGIPWAIRQLVRFQVLPQVVTLEGERNRDATRRCGRLVTGSWWWMVAVVVVVQGAIVVVAIAVPLIALVLLTSLPLWFFGALSSIAYIALGPYAAAVVTLAYGRLVAIEGEADVELPPTPVTADSSA